MSPPARAGHSTAARTTPLAVAVAGLCAPYLASEPIIAGALLLVAMVALRTAGVSAVLVLVVAVVGMARADHALRSYAAAWERQRTTFGAPQRCAVDGIVLSSPAQRGDALVFVARLDRLECERDLPSAEPVVARLYGGPDTLARGDRFEGVAQLGVARLFRNIDLPDPARFYARSGVVLSGSLLAADPGARRASLSALIDRARSHIRRRIRATFQPQVEALARALVLGENDLTPEEAAAFSLSGLSHLLAVSGTHLVFAVASLVGGLEFLLRRLPPLAERWRPDRVAALVGAPLACLYADLAGGSGSAWRAAWMLSATYALRAANREPDALVAVAASITVGWLLQPLVVYDLSFMLSLAATFGLLTLGHRAAAACAALRHKALRLLALGIVATVSSLIPCSVLLALIAPTLSLVGILANVFVAPFGEAIALPLCLAHTLMGPFPWLERGTAQVASGALAVVRATALQTAALTDRVPALAIALLPPSPAHMCILLGALLLCWRQRRWLEGPGGPPKALLGLLGVATLLALSWLEAHHRRRAQPVGGLRVQVLDVGQGDSTWVDLPTGELMVIDGGGFVGSPVDPGTRVLLPLLRARRRTRIDYLVLSHPHPDHFSGLLALADAVEIGEFWDTGQGQREGAGPLYAELIATLRRRGVPILAPRTVCARTQVGGARLDVLAPCPAFLAGRGANDNSWVFRLASHKSSILFTGDAEEATEQQLVATAADRLTAQVLKVGHHGSRTSSTPAFVRAVHPQIATISCGVRNRYGHPHPQTLQTLRGLGVSVLRSDAEGSILLQSTPTGFSYRTHRELAH